jgi:hypothetical protein
MIPPTIRMAATPEVMAGMVAPVAAARKPAPETTAVAAAATGQAATVVAAPVMAPVAKAATCSSR